MSSGHLGIGSFTATTIPNHVTVGKYSSIGRGCIFHDTGHHLCKTNKACVFTTNWFQPDHPKSIIIGNDVWIGEGVRILEDILIGDGAIIGAGTVISKDVPPFAVVVGNPPRIIRFRFTDDQIRRLQKMRWWSWDEKIIEDRKEDMLDITTFLKKYE